MKRIIWLFLILITFSCEKDDFCIKNPVTPKLILRFYDANAVLDLKNVNRFSAIANSKTDSLFTNLAVDSISIPLNPLANQTIYTFKKDTVSGNNSNNQLATLTINYNIKEEYVSRSCGFKIVYSDLILSIDNGWIFSITPETLVNINSTKKDEIFNEAKLELRILNGKISFDKSVFINNNIGLMEISNSDLFLDNDKLFLSSNLSIDIKNIDKLYSFLNTNKNSRKNIRNIKLNIIYDFLSNQIELKNIKINGNDVSSQFNNIAEGFIDINSNNLTKSRRLLNELINLYDG